MEGECHEPSFQQQAEPLSEIDLDGRENVSPRRKTRTEKIMWSASGEDRGALAGTEDSDVPVAHGDTTPPRPAN